MNMLETLEKKVFSYIENHNMIQPQDKIVLGVSGGADSVCLLLVLHKYAGKVPIELTVVHVNHGIRPDAGEDAAYVEELCAELGVPFHLVEADVERLAAEEKCSTEDMGRRIRYQAFLRVGEAIGGAKIAVAHNNNDNAETMLFHLFRGSGLKGLCGIVPVREEEIFTGSRHLSENKGMWTNKAKIIRPILCLERREIENYLQAKGIPWCTDGTNHTDDYTRNRIRHHILPYAEENIVSGVVRHMGQTADMLREVEEYLELQTGKALEKCLTENFVLDCDKFLQEPAVLQKRMLFALAKELSPTGKDISQVHIADMLTLFANPGNRSINLPFGICARREYEKVVLERKIVKETVLPEVGKNTIQISLEQLSEEESLTYNLGNSEMLEFSLVFSEKLKEVPRNQYTKWFDYDKILECPVIRKRVVGDYFTIHDGYGGSRRKSLKDYMIAEKIPKQIRDEIPLIAVGNHVLWLVGYRISEYFKVSGNTKHILQVKLVTKDCKSSGTEEENV